MAAGIAILKTAKVDCIEAGSGHDSQLPGAGYGPGKTPIGDSGPHPALDQNRQFSGHHVMVGRCLLLRRGLGRSGVRRAGPNRGLFPTVTFVLIRAGHRLTLPSLPLRYHG